jgi:Xaa-Pro aminopeptidase
MSVFDLNLSKLKGKMISLGLDSMLISMYNRFGNFEYDVSDIGMISGFSGSNGKALVTMDESVLLVDGRYVKQAKDQVNSFDWKVEVYPDVNSNSMIARHVKRGQKLGIFTESLSHNSYLSISNLSNNIDICVDTIKASSIFSRDVLATTLYVMDEIDIGESVKSRLGKVAKTAASNGAVLTTDKSLIGWAFGIRLDQQASDRSVIPSCVAIIPYNETPVVFCDLELRDETSDFEFARLSDFEKYCDRLNCCQHVCSDFSKVVSYFSLFLQSIGLNLQNLGSKNTVFFAVKNDIEIKNQKNAAWKTSVAFMSTLKHVEECVSSTEIDVSEFFENELKKCDDFVGLSFNPISSFKESTSIVHYNPFVCGNKNISGDGLFLFDGGAHFKNATTDMTRVIYKGNAPESDLKNIYTAVLKSVIEFSSLKFPSNSMSCQIDTIARFNIWNLGLDYNFGTGHGVGAFGNVHECPRVSQQCNDVISRDMIITVEPGVYKDNFGIRLENMLLTNDSKNDGFLEFETITYIPLCRKLINVSLLNSSQIKWINSYNRQIRNRASDLNESLKDWVYKNTEDI